MELSTCGTDGGVTAFPKLSQAEERRLLLAAQAGDRAAMEQVVTQYLPLVKAAGHQRFAQSFAEDATAAAAEELVRSVRAFDAGRGVPFAAFAKVRVYGAVSHLFRKMQGKWEHECAPSTAEDLECMPDGGRFDAVEARLSVMEFARQLSKDERRVLRLLYAEGKTMREAAGELGISLSAVARKKRQALGKMREAAENEDLF